MKMSEIEPENYTVEFLVAYINHKLGPAIIGLAKELVDSTLENGKLREQLAAREEDPTARNGDAPVLEAAEKAYLAFHEWHLTPQTNPDDELLDALSDLGDALIQRGLIQVNGRRAIRAIRGR